MTAFIQEGAPVIVQGMTGHQGMTHTARMLRAGTNIVGLSLIHISEPTRP